MIFRYSRIIETLCLNHYIRSRKEGGKTTADKHFFKDKTHNLDIFLYKVLNKNCIVLSKNAVWFMADQKI